MPIRIDGTGYIGSANNIFTDGSGNVGIGTATVAASLEIAKNVNGVFNAIRLSNANTASAAPGASIEWTQGGGVKSSIECNTYGQDYMAFRCGGAGGNIERMRIDGSGRITKPYQPCWSGHCSTFSSTVTGGSNHVSGTSYTGTALPNGVLINVGSIWNTTTGRVTIPVSGYYQINVIGHKDAATAARDGLATISVNGSYYEIAEQYGPYQEVGGSLIIYLAANDWIEAGRNFGFTNCNRITFSGYLLG